MEFLAPLRSSTPDRNDDRNNGANSAQDFSFNESINGSILTLENSNSNLELDGQVNIAGNPPQSVPSLIVLNNDEEKVGKAMKRESAKKLGHPNASSYLSLPFAQSSSLPDTALSTSDSSSMSATLGCDCNDCISRFFTPSTGSMLRKVKANLPPKSGCDATHLLKCHRSHDKMVDVADGQKISLPTETAVLKMWRFLGNGSTVDSKFDEAKFHEIWTRISDLGTSGKSSPKTNESSLPQAPLPPYRKPENSPVIHLLRNPELRKEAVRDNKKVITPTKTTMDKQKDRRKTRSRGGEPSRWSRKCLNSSVSVIPDDNDDLIPLMPSRSLSLSTVSTNLDDSVAEDNQQLAEKKNSRRLI